MNSVKMYLITSDTLPREGTADFNKYGGGTAVCLINLLDQTLARQNAIALIESHGWRVKKITEEKIVSSDTYAGGHEAAKYFEQALIDGEVCVIYTFPKNE